MTDKRKRRRSVARYKYRTSGGTVAFVVHRFDPKGFMVRSLNRGHYPRVPYRLPELLSADPSRVVFIVEGEKDVERLWAEGLVGTCNAFGGGRGKWTAGHSRYLRSRDVVILPDHDHTGEEHAESVARKLHRVASRVRILRLPGLPPKGDVSDWFDAGGDAQGLLALAEHAPAWLPVPRIEIARFDFNDWCLAAGKLEEVLNSSRPAIEKLLLIVLAQPTREPLTQETIAHCLGVTPRRVRQLLSQIPSPEKRRLQSRGRPRKTR